MQNIFAKVGLLEQTKEGGEEENNDRKWTILKNISVKEQDTMKHTENGWTIQGRGERIKNINRGVWLIKV
jgi:hypothetical protein